MLAYKKMWEELKGRFQEDYNKGRIRKATLTLIEGIEEKYSKDEYKEEEKELVTKVSKEPKKKGRKK